MTTVTLTGAGTWTCPANVTSVYVELQGGSASGGGSGAAIGWDGGGAGAGEYAADTIATTPGQGYAYAQGAAGSAATGAVGHDGGDTTFGTGPLVIAHGGKGGRTSQTGNALGGAGGTGSAAALHYDGGGGGNGTVNSNGGGGGAVATAAGPGAPGSGATAATGGGAGGTAGHPAGYPGTAGGGGGAYSAAAAAQPSGAGIAGSITLTYTAGTAGGASPALETGTSGAGTAGAGGALGTPYAVLASAAVLTTGTTYTGTVAAPVALGDAIVVNAATNLTVITAVADSKGNTYTQRAANATGTMKAVQFVSEGSTALVIGDTITITFGNITQAAQAGMIVRACPGVLTSSATDSAGTGSANGSSSAPAITGMTTLAQASEWVSAFLADSNAAGAPSAWSGGFTQAGSSLHSVNQPYLTAADLRTGSTAAPAAGATLPGSAAWALCQTALKATPAGSAAQGFVIPSGAASGDEILIWAAAAAAGVTWSAPGFTATTAASGTGGSCQLLSHRMDGTEGWTPGTSVVTVTATGAQPWAGIICAVTGESTTAPFDPAPSVSGQVNVAGTTVAVPGVTTVTDGDLLLWFAFADGTSAAGDAPPAISLPAGFTRAGLQVNSTGGTALTNVGVTLAFMVQGTHGATGAQNGSLPSSKVNGGLLVALQRPVVTAGGAALRAGTGVFATAAAAATLDVTVPSGVTAGDLIQVYMATAAANNSWTAPGFTGVTPAGTASGSGQLLYRRMDGSEGWTPGTSKVTVTSNLIAPWAAAIVAVTGQDRSVPFDPAPVVSGQVNVPVGGGTAGQVGVFFNAGNMGVADYNAASALWAGSAWTGKTVKVTRKYKALSGFGFSTDSDLQEMIAAGILVCLTLRPAYNPVSATDLTNMESLLSQMRAAGCKAEITLHHEPFYSGLSASQYQAMIAYYGPTVRRYYPLIMCASASAIDSTLAGGYYPGDGAVDGLAVDCYAYSWNTGTTLDSIAAIADAASPKKPLGLWEFSGSTDPVNGQSQTVVTNYFSYVQSFFAARLAAGKPNGQILLFNSGNANALGNDSNQACGFEGGISPWQPSGGCTIAASSAQAHSRSGALRMTATGTTNMSARQNTAGNYALGLAVTPGQIVSAFGWAKAVTIARNCQATIEFYTSAGVLVSTASGTPAANNTSTWAQISNNNNTVPATAAYAFARLQVNAPAGAGEQHDWDDISIFIDGPSPNQVNTIGFGYDYRLGLWVTMYNALNNVSPAGASTLPLAGLTTVADGDQLIAFYFTEGGQGDGSAPPAITIPAGWAVPAGGAQVNTAVGGTATNIGVTVAAKTQTTHGATGAADTTIAGTAARVTGGMLVAVRKPVTVARLSALAGALLDPALYGGDPSAAVAGFDETVSRVIGIRASSYPQGVIPLSASDDGAPPPPPGANTVTVTNPGAQSSTAGSADSLQLAGADSDPSQTLTWAASGLPAGLSLNTATGLISGTPTTAGSSTVTATGTDTTGASGSAVFTWNVTASTTNTVTVTNPGNQAATVGTPKTLTMSATDSAGGQTLTWTVTGLPGGMAISATTGTISGTPTTAQTTSCTVTATDTTGAKGTATFGWTVTAAAANTVTVTNPGAQSSTVGSAVSLQIHATDSAAGQSFTWTASGLPAGLAISPVTGLISGTPTAAVTITTAVTATDTTGAKGTASFSWTVSPQTSTSLIYGGGYSTDPGGDQTPAYNDATWTNWVNLMGRPARVRGAFQGGSFPTTFSNTNPYWAGSKLVPAQVHVDIEPAHDGSQASAVDAFCSTLKTWGTDVIFRIFHSAGAGQFVGDPAGFKTAFDKYAPIVRKYGFKLYLSFTTYAVNHKGVNSSWIPATKCDALVYEWYHYNYFTNNERLDACLSLNKTAGLAFGFSEIGANCLDAPSPDGPAITEQQGITYFQYSRDFVANNVIKVNLPWVFALHWNQAEGAGRLTPGYAIINQPASWITWQQRIYDLHTKSTAGNPYIS